MARGYVQRHEEIARKVKQSVLRAVMPPTISSITAMKSVLIISRQSCLRPIRLKMCVSPRKPNQRLRVPGSAGNLKESMEVMDQTDEAQDLVRRTMG